MLTSNESGILHKISFAIVNMKAGVGKTALTGALASLAAKVLGWKVCVIDLDASVLLTQLAVGSIPQKTIKEALRLAAQKEDFTHTYKFSEKLGFWILPGRMQGVTKEEVRYLPHLVKKTLDSYFAGGYVDLVIVDAPGENKLVNGAVLGSVDYVAMPFALSTTGITATAVTISYIQHMQKMRGGKPVFLGMIPNRVQHERFEGRTCTDPFFEAGKVLPYVPESNSIKSSYSKHGKDTPITCSPNAVATAHLVYLFNALNNPQKEYPKYAKELRAYLGIEEKTEAALRGAS